MLIKSFPLQLLPQSFCHINNNDNNTATSHTAFGYIGIHTSSAALRLNVTRPSSSASALATTTFLHIDTTSANKDTAAYTLAKTARCYGSSKAILCVRSGGAAVLLLVNGRLSGVSIQFLGDNLSFCISRDQSSHHCGVVLPGLFL